MKITVEFESLEEFNQYFGASEAKVKSKDDVGGKLHKDFKDIDALNDNYDESLYDLAKALEKFVSDKTKPLVAQDIVYNIITDLEVKPGLESFIYQKIINEFCKACVNRDEWGYTKIIKAHGYVVNRGVPLFGEDS